MNYSTSICPFECGNWGKEGKKLQKFEYLKNGKRFLDFSYYWKWKNQNLIKNDGHKP